MHKRSKFLLYVIALIALGIVGYGGSYLIAIGFLPHIRNAGSYVAMTTFLMLVALSLPYGLLKLLGYAAHTINPDEIIPELRDLPKTQVQLNKSKRAKPKRTKSKR